MSNFGSGGTCASATFLSKADPTRVSELELVLENESDEKKFLLLFEDDLEGDGEPTGLSTLGGLL